MWTVVATPFDTRRSIARMSSPWGWCKCTSNTFLFFFLNLFSWEACGHWQRHGYQVFQLHGLRVPVRGLVLRPLRLGGRYVHRRRRRRRSARGGTAREAFRRRDPYSHFRGSSGPLRPHCCSHLVAKHCLLLNFQSEFWAGLWPWENWEPGASLLWAEIQKRAERNSKSSPFELPASNPGLPGKTFVVITNNFHEISIHFCWKSKSRPFSFSILYLYLYSSMPSSALLKEGILFTIRVSDF